MKIAKNIFKVLVILLQNFYWEYFFFCQWPYKIMNFIFYSIIRSRCLKEFHIFTLSEKVIYFTSDIKSSFTLLTITNRYWCSAKLNLIIHCLCFSHYEESLISKSPKAKADVWLRALRLWRCSEETPCSHTTGQHFQKLVV